MSTDRGIMEPTADIEVKETPEPVEAPDPFNGMEPTFEEFSEFRTDGTVPERFKAVAKEKPTARGGDGRFTSVLKHWREEADYRRAVVDGLVTPTDEMPADEWAIARNAQLRHGVKVALPTEPPDDQPKETESGDPEAKANAERVANVVNNRAQELMSAGASEQVAKELAQREAAIVQKLQKEHPDHYKRVAEVAAYCPDFDQLMEAGRKIPFPPGLQKDLAGLDNSGEVLIYLLRNPQNAVQLTQMLPSVARKALRGLSSDLAEFSNGSIQAKPERKQTSAPPPVEPVNTRSAAKGFDVNDDSMDPDEWAKKRNEQLYSRRRG